MNDNQNDNIVIGEVMGAHGQSGALRVRILTEFPERFQPGARLFIEGLPFTISSTQPSTETVILRFEEINTMEEAVTFRGKHLEIPVSERKILPPGRFYYHEIIGLEVYTSSGLPVGVVNNIFSTGCNDVYVVKGGGREVLIPAVKDVVQEIDLAQKRITIEAIAGLLD